MIPPVTEEMFDAMTEIVYWVDQKKSEFNPAQLSYMLMRTGASIMFHCFGDNENVREFITDIITQAVGEKHGL